MSNLLPLADAEVANGRAEKILGRERHMLDSPGRGSMSICICDDAHEACSNGCSLLSSQMILTPLLRCVVCSWMAARQTHRLRVQKSLDSEPNRPRLTK
jgi:hypothetical protein